MGDILLSLEYPEKYCPGMFEMVLLEGRKASISHPDDAGYSISLRNIPNKIERNLLDYDVGVLNLLKNRGYSNMLGIFRTRLTRRLGVGVLLSTLFLSYTSMYNKMFDYLEN